MVVTKFSAWLEDNEPGTTSDDHSLSQLMHRNGTVVNTTHPRVPPSFGAPALSHTDGLLRLGINVRYLGVLYHLAKRSMVKKAIFREICVRVIKNALRERLRQVSSPSSFAFPQLCHSAC